MQDKKVNKTVGHEDGGGDADEIIVEIKVKEDVVEKLTLKKGDDPKAIAIRFCKEHGKP